MVLYYLLNEGLVYVDNVTANAGAGGATFATDDIGGIQYPRTKVTFGVDGSSTDVSASNPLPITQPGSKTSDYDTGAGTDTVQMVGIALPASGGAVQGGTATNPVRVDVTGTTPQPITDNGGSLTVDSTQWPSSLGQKTMTNSFAVVIASDQSAVPISAASLPLPSGATTAAKQPALGTAGTASTDVISVQGISGMTALKVDGSAVTQPVSAASLPLPSGAATSAKQPALGTAGTASTDVLTVQGIASMTALKVDGSAVTQPISAASLPLPTGAALASKQATPGTAGTPSADVITVQGATSMTALKVDGSAVTQPVSGNVGQSGTWTVQPGNTANTTPWLVSLQVATSGGSTPYRVISAATTNAANVKASAGQIYGYAVFNTNASPRYLKIYNKASSPTVGTDTPAMTILIPGNASGAGANTCFANGIAFGTGIGVAITTGMADSDTGAVGANEVIINLWYK